MQYGNISGGKNLLNPLIYETNNTIMDGVSFSVIGNNMVKINGTSANGYQACYFTILTAKIGTGIFIVGKKLTMSTTQGKIAVYALYSGEYHNIGVYKNFDFTISENWESIIIRLVVADVGETYNNEIAYLQLEYGETATSYEPYIMSNNILTKYVTELISKVSVLEKK